ncbi:MAG: four helix bundle protein [Candidatus Omnitrophica bacterium]|nr:four helix bundle protein [Candidatus Omnitrophota bacterium]
MTEDRRQKTDDRGWGREEMETKIRSIKDLKVYTLTYRLAMDVFNMTKKFPKEETYSLIDQVRRSSRSVAINIREGFAKRKYEQVFIRHLNDAFGSSEETRGWLDFSLDCGYLGKDTHEKLDKQYDEANAMLYTLMSTWKQFSNT